MSTRLQNTLICGFSFRRKCIKGLALVFCSLNQPLLAQNIPAAMHQEKPVEVVLDVESNQEIQSSENFEKSVIKRTKLNKRNFLPKRFLKLTRSNTDLADFLFATGAILAILGIFMVILFHWIGPWAFLIAICSMALGLTLIGMSGNYTRDVHKFAIAMGFWGVLALDIIGMVLWGIIGLFIWLIP